MRVTDDIRVSHKKVLTEKTIYPYTVSLILNYHHSKAYSIYIKPKIVNGLALLNS